jgi:ankyrin repeat protein
MKLLLTILAVISISVSAFAQDNELNEKMITAAAKGETSKVSAYLKKGADINSKNKARWTALAYACKYGHPEVVKLLLEKKADVNCKVNTGSTPLYIALNGGYYNIADMLVANKADVNLSDIMGMSPLAWAVKESNVKMVKYLLDKGANVNSVNTNSRSVMDICNNPEIEKLLRAKGAKTTMEMINDNK